MANMPHWNDLIAAYAPESDVYIAVAMEADRTGQPGTGYDLYEYLHSTQGVHLGPSVWYGNPNNLTQYVWEEDTQTLLTFAKEHLGPPNPQPPSPPSPPAPPSPPTPPSPPSPTPTPAPPSPTPPSPPRPTGQYVVADQSYFCPLDYLPIHSAEECKAAIEGIPGIAGKGKAVLSESEHGDPPGCWAYGTKDHYDYIYLNADGSTDQKQYRPQRSAICERSANKDVVV